MNKWIKRVILAIFIVFYYVIVFLITENRVKQNKVNEISKFLEDNGYIICYNSDINEDKYGFKNQVIGVCNPNTKTIEIETYEAYLHELGHAYDFETVFSGKEYFTNLYNKYNNIFTNNYFKDDIEEFFAETFAMYFREENLPEELESYFKHLLNL